MSQIVENQNRDQKVLIRRCVFGSNQTIFPQKRHTNTPTPNSSHPLWPPTLTSRIPLPPSLYPNIPN
jgi:hypothetical protein